MLCYILLIRQESLENDTLKGVKVMGHPNKIKELRLNLGLTQQQLGMKFKEQKDLTVISRWERGINKPSADSLIELAKIFKVQPSNILIYNKTDKSG